jgi:hypothetical protein
MWKIKPDVGQSEPERAVREPMGAKETWLHAECWQKWKKVMCMFREQAGQ